MENVSVAEMAKSSGSIYKLVILTARRAIELNEGAARLVKAPLIDNAINIALKEISEGKVSYKIKSAAKE